MKASYHHGDLRETLIKKGLEMLQAEGLDKLSLRRLAKACGVSEAAPYSHFKNKEELLVSIYGFVSDAVYQCMKDAYEAAEDKNSPAAIMDMGKAYVCFFEAHPEYFTFISNQESIKIDLSMKGVEDEFPAFSFFREKAYEIYGKAGLEEQRIKYGIIAMWAKVHGIAAIAAMKSVSKDFEWAAVIENILVE